MFRSSAQSLISTSGLGSGRLSEEVEELSGLLSVELDVLSEELEDVLEELLSVELEELSVELDEDVLEDVELLDEELEDVLEELLDVELEELLDVLSELLDEEFPFPLHAVSEAAISTAVNAAVIFFILFIFLPPLSL